jgi:parallel beta-helix repeat protein
MLVSEIHEGRYGRARRARRVLSVLAVAGALAVPLAAASVPANAGTKVSAAGAAGTGTDTTVTPSDWTSAGANASDTHESATETAISPANVSGLQEKWSYTTTGDVMATPAVVNGAVYAPDLGGSLSAVSAGTGAQLWSRPISDYTGVPDDVSRTTPAYWEGELVLGDGAAEAAETGEGGDGAFVFAVDATTGAKLWSTQVESNPVAFITGSPVVSNGIVYVGTSSLGEEVPGETFRGSLVALDAATGAILWKTYTVPEGYTGGAVWGSNPVVDAQTGLVYAGTGNNYTTPAGVCGTPTQTGCTAPAADDDFDSVLAFNATTGAIVWAKHTLSADTFLLPSLPGGPGVDGDFGADPNLVTTTINGQQTQVLVIGQKTGNLWALDPATGDVIWDTDFGPDGIAGGLHWGTASDGSTIYVADNNYNNTPMTITSATGQTSTITTGFWAAVDTATGNILWETAVPSGALDPYSFVSAANGVMYSGTLSPTGNNMYAIDGATGTVEWSFPSGGTVVDGAAIVDGTVYWGSGYPTLGLGFPFDGSNDKLYAFTLPQSAPPAQVYVSTSGTAGGADTSCATAGFTSINAAIQAVASNGTVTVCGGTYTEEADVTKPVTLTVSGNVIINASGLLHGIDVLAPNVTVAGFTVENAIAAGILVDHASNTAVDGNIVSGDDQGAGASPFYAQCTTGREDCGGGIDLLGASGSTVSGNTVSDDASGIVVSDETGPATGNTVTGNLVQGNTGAGIVLAGDNPAAAPGGTPAPAAGGVYSNTITSNTAENNGTGGAGGGIVLTSAASGGAVYNNAVSDNVLSGNAWAGITVHSLATGQDFNGNTLTSNVVGTNNTQGDSQTGTTADTQTTGILVAAAGPLTITITGNNIGSDQIGIWLAGPVTAANAASGNTFSGVTTPVSTQ